MAALTERLKRAVDLSLSLSGGAPRFRFERGVTRACRSIRNGWVSWPRDAVCPECHPLLQSVAVRRIVFCRSCGNATSISSTMDRGSARAVYIRGTQPREHRWRGPLGGHRAQQASYTSRRASAGGAWTRRSLRCTRLASLGKVNQRGLRNDRIRNPLAGCTVATAAMSSTSATRTLRSCRILYTRWRSSDFANRRAYAASGCSEDSSLAAARRRSARENEISYDIS